MGKKVKNKKKKKTKENAGPPHQQRQPYSKQNSKNKAKAQEKKLEKNWDTAKAEIIKWAKKNRNSLPGDYDAWIPVIKKQIMRNLYPNFSASRETDVDLLAANACNINFMEYFSDEEEKVVASPKIKKQKQKQPRKNKQQKKMNNGSPYQQPQPHHQQQEQQPSHLNINSEHNQQQNNYQNGIRTVFKAAKVSKQETE